MTPAGPAGPPHRDDGGAGPGGPMPRGPAPAGPSPHPGGNPSRGSPHQPGPGSPAAPGAGHERGAAGGPLAAPGSLAGPGPAGAAGPAAPDRLYDSPLGGGPAVTGRDARAQDDPIGRVPLHPGTLPGARHSGLPHRPPSLPGL